MNSFDETNVPFNVLMNIDRHGAQECYHCEAWYKPVVTLKLHAKPIKMEDVQPGDLQAVPGDQLPINDTTVWA